MQPPVQDLSLASTELYLAALAVLIFVLDLVLPRTWRKEIAMVAGLGLVVALVPAAWLWQGNVAVEFSGAFLSDNLAIVLKMIFILAGALTVLMSVEYFMGLERGFGEFFGLLVFFVMGLCFMASAGDLIVLYGLTGSLKLPQVAQALTTGHSFLAAMAAGLVVAGLGYKIAMSPFHWWSPDVYEGAPTPVTAFLSVGPKLAGFVLFVRVLQIIVNAAPNAWPAFLSVLAAVTMFTGNLLAIRQTNIKRMLAYSSIAHAGYMLIGIVVATCDPAGLTALVVYAAAYLFMNLGAFAVALIVEAEAGDSLIASFSGLAQRLPIAAAAMFVFLLSLTGIPPTAGFVGKLMLFAAAIKQPQFAWLAVVAIVNSVISLYYYMNVVRVMYFGKPSEKANAVVASGSLTTAMWAALALTILIGIMPQSLISLAEASCRALAGM